MNTTSHCGKSRGRLAPAFWFELLVGSARKSCFRSRSRRGLLVENKFAAFRRVFHRLALVKIALEQFFRERVFEITLDRTPHRMRAVSRVVALLDEKIFRLRVEIQHEVFAL